MSMLSPWTVLVLYFIGHALGWLAGMSFAQTRYQQQPRQIICDTTDLDHANWQRDPDPHVYPAWTIVCGGPDNPSPGTIVVLD